MVTRYVMMRCFYNTTTLRNDLSVLYCLPAKDKRVDRHEAPRSLLLQCECPPPCKGRGARPKRSVVRRPIEPATVAFQTVPLSCETGVAAKCALKHSCAEVAASLPGTRPVGLRVVPDGCKMSAHRRATRYGPWRRGRRHLQFQKSFRCLPRRDTATQHTYQLQTSLRSGLCDPFHSDISCRLKLTRGMGHPAFSPFLLDIPVGWSRLCRWGCGCLDVLVLRL